MKAIKDFSIRIGEKTRQGEADWPAYSVHKNMEWADENGENRARIHGCVLADEWKTRGENAVGRFYCYLDVAKSMRGNSNEKIVHVSAIPDVMNIVS
ncbi:hypothetical protein GTO27_04930 [Candidatus Bathyarchaeota archaeon]|nr:hypothetical protein [Candidatus Bathyarchaeota archaeon]